MADTLDTPKIPASEKPVSDDFEYAYVETVNKAFVRIAKERLKEILGANRYTNEEIDQKISTIPKFNIEVVSSLPTTDISETTVYLVSSGDDSENLYTEYININGLWEILGTQKSTFSGSAKDVTYDDTETNLGATNVQDAVGKLSETVNDLKENGTGTGESYNLPIATSETLGGVKPVSKTDAMTQEVGVDSEGKLYTEPTTSSGESGDGTIGDGSITTEKIADGAVTAEKTSFFEKTVASESVMMPFNGVYALKANADTYEIGLSYGNRCAVAVNLKANHKYMCVSLSSGAGGMKTLSKFNGVKPSSDYPNTRMWEADIDENNELTGTYTEITPTYLTSWTNNMCWFNGYNEYNNPKYDTYPIEINGTTYYLKNLIFTVDKDFRGLIGIEANVIDDNATYVRILDASEHEYNVLTDGMLPPVESGVGESYVIHEQLVKSVIEKNIRSDKTINNSLYGLKWYAFGDSLTQYAGGGSNTDNEEDTGFITQIMRQTGVIGKNGGKAGLKWSSGTDGTLETGSAVDRVNTIINGDEMYDIVTFAYGTNSDVDGDGTVEDAPTYDGTMCSAIKWCIEKLVEWNPQVQIGIILPPQRADMGTKGNELMKTRGALIREVAELYGVPCCDMWRESGINTMYYVNPSTGNNKYYFLGDMLHLSELGKEKYASCLKSFLERIAPIYPNNGALFDYTITNNLTNVTNSNKADKAPSGVGYSATLTASSGTLSNVTVIMGDIDVTSTVYANGVITIDEITGDIVITATAE